MKKNWIRAGICAILLAGCLAFPAQITRAEDASAPTMEDGSEIQESVVEIKEEKGAIHCYIDGKMVKKEWQTVDGKKYYFKSDGSAATLSTKISGKYYIFSKKGVLYSPKSTSVVTIGKVKYQVKSNGIAASGWSKDKTYYFDKTGKRITGIQVIKGKFYSFASSGKINSSKTKKLQKAAKYEKNIATLRKLLGKPSKVRYYSSCYGDGKDGVWKYKNFTVYTFKPRKGKEIFMGVE